MSLETKSELNNTTIEKLQQLIQVNVDSSNGFRESAEDVEDSKLAALFKEMGEQRSAIACDLRRYVEVNGEVSRDEGSIAAAFHRVWINIRAKLSGGDPYVILSEVERGEDHIKHAYEDVLKETAGSAMNDILSDQYRVIKTSHDRIRNLRDSFKRI